jgi:hypothetical protein
MNPEEHGSVANTYNRRKGRGRRGDLDGGKVQR